MTVEDFGDEITGRSGQQVGPGLWVSTRGAVPFPIAPSGAPAYRAFGMFMAAASNSSVAGRFLASPLLRSSLKNDAVALACLLGPNLNPSCLRSCDENDSST